MSVESLTQLSHSLAKNFSCLVQHDNKVSLLTVLITFWHAVLNLAVEFEEESIKTAREYKEKHNCDGSPWKSTDFAKYLKKIHDKKFGQVVQSIDSVPTENPFFLMPFLMTMRLESWFDDRMLEINCSLQLLIRFEQSYIPQSQRRYANVEQMSNNYAMQVLLRQVWHAIVSCYSMVYNNAFAFCVQSMLPTHKVMWKDYCIDQIYTVAGSLMKPTVMLSSNTRVFAHGDGNFEETTWILLSAYHEKTNEHRIMQCTLTQNNLSCNLYIKPLLPLIILPPYPLIHEDFSSTVLKKESLAEEIVEHSIDSTVVKVAILWTKGVEKREKNSAYRVDKLCEMSQIKRRMTDLYICMIDGANLVARMQIQLRKTIADAKTNKLQNFAETQKKVNEDCTLIIHMRNNSVGMFSLLKILSAFNVLNT